MAYTIEGEYKRLTRLKKERERRSDWKRFSFECGCACGYVTRIEYVPWSIYEKEHLEVYGIAGFSNEERLLFIVSQEDVEKAHNRRKYIYWKQWGILELFR